ncbi:MAG: theronine dehydrogenase, partial [Deltaproteobacteria bacterium]|nr:theronine dehydrogenase [Deltaproteobacteria bacterium]
MDSIVYNEWRLVSLSPFPTWALGLMAVAIAVGVWLSTLALRRESRPGRRWLLLGLRGVAALALIALLLEPGQRLMQTSRVKNRVALLLDRSASMGFPASPGGEPRLETAKKLL